VCYLAPDDGCKLVEVTQSNAAEDKQKCLKTMDDLLNSLQDDDKKGSTTMMIDPWESGTDLVYIAIQSERKRYGLIGFLTSTADQVSDGQQRSLRFLAELGAITMERREAEDLAARLKVAEEQNRIANEIHDGVSQNLFNIVYALHALGKKNADLQEEEVQQQLGLIKKTANDTARELRAFSMAANMLSPRIIIILIKKCRLLSILIS
jgi:signal transduction histidine kinase